MPSQNDQRLADTTDWLHAGKTKNILFCLTQLYEQV